MLRTPFSWTDQNIAILRQMVAEGHSANEIGCKLGTSRNSVIGKAMRMEIALAGSRAKPSRRAGKAPKSVPRSPRPVACDEAEPIVFIPEPEVPEAVAPVEFALLEAHHCKFPIDDNIGPHMFCCGGRRLYGSYCAEHAAIARGRGTESERKATSVGRAW